MKALTLYQPWASLIAFWEKTIETRSWPTRHRGPLAIHSGKTLPPGWEWHTPEIKAALWDRRVDNVFDLPRGAVLATCVLVDCIRTGELWTPPADQMPFGDFTPGRFAWILEDIKCLPEPIPAKGAMGLWEWEVPHA